MTADSPLAQSGSTARLNASHSRTYLTRRNYTGPQLLRGIRGRSSPSSEAKAPALRAVEMDSLQENDIMAPPISSDEEESTPNAARGRSIKQNSPTSAKRKADGPEQMLPSRKRIRSEGKPTRRSERTTQNTVPESTPDSSMSMPDFLTSSQSSQQKKRKTQYGKTGSYHRPSSQGIGFADPGELPSTPRKSKSSSFRALDEPPSSRTRTPNKKLKAIDIPSSAEKVVEKSSAFKMPDGPSMLESSSISTEQSKVFDVDDSPEVQPRKRASSTSSLSSVDSIASYELSQKQKDELRDGTTPQGPVPKGCIRCPICQRTVDVSTHAKKPDPENLSLRKQQTFCHNHRVNDAQAEWKAKGYPVINWDALEKQRVPQQIPHLRQILYKKVPSYYFSHLESKLSEAKGNQSVIRRYLANEIVEVVKTGYYGPKGAKIMGNKITSEMSNHLKRSLKADKTVRAVGVSGFVSAVLLPELLQQIVYEDMNLLDEPEARHVISESTEAGMLLWPDDDHVVRNDDDENVEVVK